MAPPRLHTSAHVSIQHTSAYGSIHQHTAAYVRGGADMAQPRVKDLRGSGPYLDASAGRVAGFRLAPLLPCAPSGAS